MAARLSRDVARTKFIRRLSRSTPFSRGPKPNFPDYTHVDQKQQKRFSPAIPLSLWRGGTSKGLFFDLDKTNRILRPSGRAAAESDAPDRTGEESTSVPAWLQRCADIGPHLPGLLGSPDPYQRQLDGLGGGISSLSKAVMVDVRDPATLAPHARREGTPSELLQPAVNYTFIQVGVDDGQLDYSGNCGNLTAAVGPFVAAQASPRLVKYFSRQLEQKMPEEAVFIRQDQASNDPALATLSMPVSLDIHNNNTNKTIRTTFWMSRIFSHGKVQWVHEPRGSFVMPGIPGTGSEVRLQWLDPGGSRTPSTLPTGNRTDTIVVDDVIHTVSCVDVSNPGIFVDGRQLQWDATRSPNELDAETDLMATLDKIRCRGTEMMGLDPKEKAVPKIVMVFPSSSDDRHIDCQALSMQKAHKAVPGTLALNLGAACQMEGTIPHQLARKSSNGKIIIGHPTGTAEVGAKISSAGDVESVEISRTARWLMTGYSTPVTRDYEVKKVTSSQLQALQLEAADNAEKSQSST